MKTAKTFSQTKILENKTEKDEHLLYDSVRKTKEEKILKNNMLVKHQL